MMRALTLTQPWCGLVASGIKRIENRPRSMIKREDFGKPFALHASREIDYDVYERVYELAPELRPEPAMRRWYPLTRITSAVIAVSTISSVIELSGEEYADAIAFAGQPSEQVRWAFGPVCYVLRDVRALAKPVPCRGWQGFWTLPDDIERQVREQLAS